MVKNKLEFKARLDKEEHKQHPVHSDKLKFEQKEERKERRFAGSGKPKSIASADLERYNAEDIH